MDCFLCDWGAFDFGSCDFGALGAPELGWIFICFAIMFTTQWIVAGLMIVAGWTLFTKAGKPGWTLLVPVYNLLVLLQIIGKSWWWLLLLCIPFVNLIFYIWGTNLLAKSFGKKADFTIGLLLLPIVFYPILAFSKTEYMGPAGASGR